MLRMVPPLVVPPGPCTAATDGPPGPSMAPQTVPVAPQVVPPCHNRPPDKINVYINIYAHKSDWMILWFTIYVYAY